MKPNTYNLNPEIIHSRAWKSQEMQKANEALQKAKSLNRPCRRALSSECEFSRNLVKKEVIVEEQNSKYLNSTDISKHFQIGYYAFRTRVQKYKIPFIMDKKRSLFLIEDVEKHLNEYPLVNKKTIRCKSLN